MGAANIGSSFTMEVNVESLGVNLAEIAPF